MNSTDEETNPHQVRYSDEEEGDLLNRFRTDQKLWIETKNLPAVDLESCGLKTPDEVSVVTSEITPKTPGSAQGKGKKRRRRTAAQIDRKFICTYLGCNKGYGTEASLNQHMRNKHSSPSIGRTSPMHSSQMTTLLPAIPGGHPFPALAVSPTLFNVSGSSHSNTTGRVVDIRPASVSKSLNGTKSSPHKNTGSKNSSVSTSSLVFSGRSRSKSVPLSPAQSAMSSMSISSNNDHGLEEKDRQRKYHNSGKHSPRFCVENSFLNENNEYAFTTTMNNSLSSTSSTISADVPGMSDLISPHCTDTCSLVMDDQNIIFGCISNSNPSSNNVLQCDYSNMDSSNSFVEQPQFLFDEVDFGATAVNNEFIKSPVLARRTRSSSYNCRNDKPSKWKGIVRKGQSKNIEKRQSDNITPENEGRWKSSSFDASASFNYDDNNNYRACNNNYPPLFPSYTCNFNEKNMLNIQTSMDLPAGSNSVTDDVNVDLMDNVKLSEGGSSVNSAIPTIDQNNLYNLSQGSKSSLNNTGSQGFETIKLKKEQGDLGADETTYQKSDTTTSYPEVNMLSRYCDDLPEIADPLSDLLNDSESNQLDHVKEGNFLLLKNYLSNETNESPHNNDLGFDNFVNKDDEPNLLEEFSLSPPGQIYFV